MLKFKPAPIYILDEVDAALDLSHTQNIGAMIKTHFKESQVNFFLQLAHDVYWQILFFLFIDVRNVNYKY